MGFVVEIVLKSLPTLKILQQSYRFEIQSILAELSCKHPIKKLYNRLETQIQFVIFYLIIECPVDFLFGARLE